MLTTAIQKSACCTAFEKCAICYLLNTFRNKMKAHPKYCPFFGQRQLISSYTGMYVYLQLQ